VFGPREERAWRLFADWCVASGQVALPATPQVVATFFAEVPASRDLAVRRAKAIDAMHAAGGYELPGRDETVRALFRPQVAPRSCYDGEQVAQALSAIVVGGWPVGLVGRRDGAIVAMVCVGGFTRRSLVAMGTGSVLDLPALLARLGRDGSPGACPACAVSRWLRARAAVATRGWRWVREQLADLGEVRAATLGRHDCERDLSWPPETCGNEPLFAAIDRHGGMELRLALSARSVSTVVHRRLAVPVEPTITSQGRWVPRPSSQEVEGARQRLDALTGWAEQAVDAADAVLARFEAAVSARSWLNGARRPPGAAQDGVGPRQCQPSLVPAEIQPPGPAGRQRRPRRVGTGAAG